MEDETFVCAHCQSVLDSEDDGHIVPDTSDEDAALIFICNWCWRAMIAEDDDEPNVDYSDEPF